MKCTVFFLLCYFLSAALWGQDYSKLPYVPAPDHYKLKGKALALSWQKKIPPGDSAHYRRQGMITPGINWKTEASEEMHFDSSGNVLARVYTMPGKERNKLRKGNEQFFYQAGKLIAVAVREDDKRADSVYFHYKKKGLPEYYLLFNGDNQLQYKVTFTYDKERRLTLVRKKDKGNYPIGMIKFKYDKEGLRQQQYFNRQYQLERIVRFSRQVTPSGQINYSEAVFDAGGKMQRGLSTVKDSAGNLLEESVISADRQVTDYRRYDYNQQGDRVEEHLFTPQEWHSAIVYQYDDRDNWVRKEVYNNEQLQDITIRELTY